MSWAGGGGFLLELYENTSLIVTVLRISSLHAAPARTPWSELTGCLHLFQSAWSVRLWEHGQDLGCASYGPFLESLTPVWAVCMLYFCLTLSDVEKIPKLKEELGLRCETLSQYEMLQEVSIA